MGQGCHVRFNSRYKKLCEKSCDRQAQVILKTSCQIWIKRLNLACILLILCCLRAQTQESLGLFPQHSRPPEEPNFPKTLPPSPLQRPQLPPIPPPSGKAPPAPGQTRLWLRQVRIEGNTVFSKQALSEVVKPYLDRYVTSEDLEDLRRRLTRLYINAGYVNSGAVLPDQAIAEGRVTFRIIEGMLSSITLSGKHWFRDAYLRRRLTLDLEPPLNVNALQDRIRRLQRDERVKRLDAELRPGIRRGDSELHVDLLERLPYSVELAFNNYQSPSVGAERGAITLAHDNVTGRGDRWQATFGRSEGVDFQIDTRYTLPLNPRDTSISLRYARNESNVIAEAFAFLDIESRSETWELALRHPFYRDEGREFALALSGKRAHSKTYLGGEPTPLSAGVDDGVANVTSLSLTAEWLDQGSNAVLAMQSRFSLGVDAFDATINSGDVPTGRFASWSGQFQWLRRLPTRDMRLLLRLATQLTTEPLLPLEQMAIGGRYSVRGYRENRLIRDNSLLVSIETRIPLLRQKRWAEVLQVAPFMDFGRGWNRKVTTPHPTELLSLGVGLQWMATLRPLPVRAQFEIWWGYPLLHRESEGENLQDKGLHLQLVLSST